MYKINKNRIGRVPYQGGKPGPGIYDSEVVGVEESPNYSAGEAIVIRYRLTNSSGACYSYQETFRISGRATKREQKFDSYLSKLGFEEYDDFVGSKEKLKLAEEEKESGTYLNVIDREFVSYPPDIEVIEDATDE